MQGNNARERDFLRLSVSQYQYVRKYKQHFIPNIKPDTVLTFTYIYWYILSRCYILDFAKCDAVFLCTM